MKVQHLISSLVGGELSPRLNGRTDVRKYPSGCRTLQNAIVVPHGGARKRPGSKFVVPQKNSTDDVRLIPYEYSADDSYVLIFGPSYVWFLKDQGIITHTVTNITGITQANPAVVTSTAHGCSNGDYVLIRGVAGMTELNNRHFVVAGATANTFQLTSVDSSAFTAYSSGGTAGRIVNLATTYTAAQLPTLQFSSIRDVTYIAHKDHPVRKISRFSDTGWTLTVPSINTGPFRTINGDDQLRILPSVGRKTITGVNTSSTVVITAPAHGFIVGESVLITGVVATDVGGYTDPGYVGGGWTGGGEA